MEELANIHIEGKTLGYTQKDLRKLNTSEGCALNLVTERVYSVDDCDDFESDHDYDDEDLSHAGLSNEAKIERMKREFISLTLNSNNDPIKPGARSRLRRLDLDDDADESAPGEVAEGLGMSSYLKRYSNMGNYADLMIKTDSKGNRLYEEISPNRVHKRRICPGGGPQVVEDSLIIYNCAFWTQGSSEPYDSTWLRRNTNICDLANDSVLPGLYELLLSSRRGEWCEAFITPEAAFGRLGAPPRIPANAIVFCLLEVVKVVSKDKIAKLDFNPIASQKSGTSFEDFYEASDEARMRGNYFYDRKEYKAALQRYKSGIRIMEPITYKDASQQQKANILLVKLYNNCARAANCLGEPRFALVACKQAMLIDDTEPKNYWNRLTAWKKMGHFDRALGTARRAIQLAQDSRTRTTFEREADELKLKIQREKCDLDDLHRLMSRAILV